MSERIVVQTKIRSNMIYFYRFSGKKMSKIYDAFDDMSVIDIYSKECNISMNCVYTNDGRHSFELLLNGKYFFDVNRLEIKQRMKYIGMEDGPIKLVIWGNSSKKSKTYTLTENQIEYIERHLAINSI